MANTDPIENNTSATTKAQKYRSRANPNGCWAVGAFWARRPPRARSASLPASATEWIDSASRAAAPVTAKATSLAIAMPRFASSATRTARWLSSCTTREVTGRFGRTRPSRQRRVGSRLRRARPAPHLGARRSRARLGSRRGRRGRGPGVPGRGGGAHPSRSAPAHPARIGPFGATELLGGVEHQPGERRTVARKVRLIVEGPVGELVEHDALRPVSAGKGDRRRTVVGFVEVRRAGAVPRAEAGEPIEGEVRETEVPPE